MLKGKPTLTIPMGNYPASQLKKYLQSAFVSFLSLSLSLSYVLVLVQLYVESTWDVLQLTRSGSTRENPFQRNASARGSSDKAHTKIRLTNLISANSRRVRYGTYLLKNRPSIGFIIASL
jgi:hypothetical protein